MNAPVSRLLTTGIFTIPEAAELVEADEREYAFGLRAAKKNKRLSSTIKLAALAAR